MGVEIFIEESNAIEGVYSDDAVRKSVEAWNYLKEQDELTHEVVKQTHELIMEDRQPEIAGEYRDVQVYVGNHTPPPPEEVEGRMTEWLKGTNPETKEEVIAEHVKFERVHPFRDGNGRIGRLIVLWQSQEAEVEPPMWKAENKHKNYYPLFEKSKGVTTQVSE